MTKKTRTDEDKAISNKIYFNESLIAILVVTLLFHTMVFFGMFPFGLEMGKISDIILIVVSAIGVAPVMFSAYKAISEKTVTVDLLATIALLVTLFQGEWVSAAFINLMLSSSRLFSAFTERRTQNIISHLFKLRPEFVRVQDGDNIKQKKHDEVRVGDIVIIDSGDRIPVDGVVINGSGSIEESSLTGESEPLSVTVGSKVWSSTLCLSGSLFVRAEKVGADTTLSKLIKLVDEASRAKTKTEALANKFSAWYIGASLFTVIVVYFFTHNMSLVLTILLVTCADDLAVAIPLGFTVAISKAAKHGIVVKGATVMERLKDIKIFVTDKTGTLTRGVFVVEKIIPVSGMSENNVLYGAMFCSVDSKHPTSKAVLEYAGKNNKEIHPPEEVKEFPGEGVWAKHGKHEYLHGKLLFLTKNGVEITEIMRKKIHEEQMSGMSVTLVAIDKKLEGIFVLADDVRSGANSAVRETKILGVDKWIMLTGDNEYVAGRVSKIVGIDEFHANLKPEDKIDFIKKMRNKKTAIAMMGDGVNDAPALALADVSFAMGAIGSDTAIESADIALMRDDLKRVPEAIFLSNESIRIVKQNFVIWGLTNGIGLALAFTGVFNPVSASAFNFLTDFIPILNVFKIYRLKINAHTYEK